MNITEGCQADVTAGCRPLLIIMLLSLLRTICFVTGRRNVCKHLVNVYKFCVHV